MLVEAFNWLKEHAERARTPSVTWIKDPSGHLVEGRIYTDGQTEVIAPNHHRQFACTAIGPFVDMVKRVATADMVVHVLDHSAFVSHRDLVVDEVRLDLLGIEVRDYLTADQRRPLTHRQLLTELEKFGVDAGPYLSLTQQEDQRIESVAADKETFGRTVERQIAGSDGKLIQFPHKISVENFNFYVAESSLITNVTLTLDRGPDNHQYVLLIDETEQTTVKQRLRQQLADLIRTEFDKAMPEFSVPVIW